MKALLQKAGLILSLTLSMLFISSIASAQQTGTNPSKNKSKVHRKHSGINKQKKRVNRSTRFHQHEVPVHRKKLKRTRHKRKKGLVRPRQALFNNI